MAPHRGQARGADRRMAAATANSRTTISSASTSICPHASIIAHDRSLAPSRPSRGGSLLYECPPVALRLVLSFRLAASPPQPRTGGDADAPSFRRPCRLGAHLCAAAWTVPTMDPALWCLAGGWAVGTIERFCACDESMSRGTRAGTAFVDPRRPVPEVVPWRENVAWGRAGRGSPAASSAGRTGACRSARSGATCASGSASAGEGSNTPDMDARAGSAARARRSMWPGACAPAGC